MIRLGLRIEREANYLVTMAMYVNGSRITGRCGMTVRTSELVGFILQTNPHSVEVDRENVSAHLVALLGPVERDRAFIRYV